MQPWTDERMERLIGGVLRTGVLLATALVALGAVRFLALHFAERPQYAVFRGEPLALRTVSGIVRSAVDLDASGLIQVGLLALVATPVARVAFSMVAFAAERDFTYVAITFFVMGVLCYSLFGASL